MAPALISLLAFLLTEDMSLPMAMTDRWTLLMAAVAVVQLVLMLLGRRSDDRQNDRPAQA